MSGEFVSKHKNQFCFFVTNISFLVEPRSRVVDCTDVCGLTTKLIKISESFFFYSTCGLQREGNMEPNSKSLSFTSS